MLKATLVGKLEAEAKNGRGSTALSVNTDVGDVKLKASVANALALAPSFAFSLERPNSFSVDYSPEKLVLLINGGAGGFADCDRQGEGGLPNLKFKFAESVKVTGRKVSLAYSHALRERKTTVDGSVELNEENKVAVSHVVGTEDCKLKYTFARRKLTVVEPAYDFKDRAWAVAVSRKFDGGDAVRGSYEAKNRKLELEWSRTFTGKGSFKVSASFMKKDQEIVPKLMAESTWNCNL
ncbi:outer envelope pore protein 24B, chloroplastic-like [Curcuma longa]|uniref:outer envelope pore protein 24B, chloroplastic-like n=1 Tax=Curcuma longa TaxID=136217 RepID=UPI003D9FAC82